MLVFAFWGGGLYGDGDLWADGGCSYQHGRIEEPAFLLGVGYPVEGEGVEEEGK